jgi:hypothetical protein
LMASRRVASGDDAERERGVDRLRAAVAERKQARTAKASAGAKAGPRVKAKKPAKGLQSKPAPARGSSNSN